MLIGELWLPTEHKLVTSEQGFELFPTIYCLLWEVKLIFGPLQT